MKQTVLEVSGLRKYFGGIKALDGFSCALERGEIVGLVGPNGAGKTTLFDAITGFIRPNAGTIVFDGKDIVGMAPNRIADLGIARTFQNLRIVRRMSVLDNVLLAFGDQPGEKLLDLFFRPRLSARQESRNQERAILLLESVNLADSMRESAEDLSYGQQKLLILMCCLASGADLLLLDEPVAGIAPQMVETIVSFLQVFHDHGKTVLLVEHNMDAVAAVCSRVIFMDAGTNICEGTPQEIRNNPKVIEAYFA